MTCLAASYYHVTYEFQSESTLYSLPECQETPCWNQASYLKFKWQQRDSNPQVWLNGWVFVYKLSGCGFESHCCHLNMFTKSHIHSSSHALNCSSCRLSNFTLNRLSNYPLNCLYSLIHRIIHEIFHQIIHRIESFIKFLIKSSFISSFQSSLSIQRLISQTILQSVKIDSYLTS